MGMSFIVTKYVIVKTDGQEYVYDESYGLRRIKNRLERGDELYREERFFDKVKRTKIQ